MPAAPLAIAAVVSYTGAAAAISGAIVGIGASAIVADVATGVIIGAGSGALSSAIQGGDIGQGALVGGITGGVGAGISSAIGSALTPEGLQGPGLKPEIGGSSLAGVAVQKGLTGAVTGGLSSALTGGDIGRGALLGGAGGGLTGALSEGLGLTGTQSKALGGAISYGLGQAFAPDTATKQATYSTAAQPSTYSPTVFGQTSTTGSTAPLGGALLASPTLGYTPGSTFLGGSDKDKPAQNVWNQASLKEGAQVGPGSDGSQAQSS